MFLKKNESVKALLKLKNLRAGDPYSYITVGINSPEIDSFQAKKQPDGRYYVELLVKGGDPRVFDGNRILMQENVSSVTAIGLFTAVMQTGKKPEGDWKDITEEEARKHGR